MHHIRWALILVDIKQVGPTNQEHPIAIMWSTWHVFSLGLCAYNDYSTVVGGGTRAFLQADQASETGLSNEVNRPFFLSFFIQKEPTSL